MLGIRAGSMTRGCDGSAASGVCDKEKMTQALKGKIGASMGLKLVVVITGVILVLMVLGTLFVARIMTGDQYRHIEMRGKDLGLFLGKAVTDPILHKDMIKLDSHGRTDGTAHEGNREVQNVEWRDVWRGIRCPLPLVIYL